MSETPLSLGKWMRRYSLALVAALGGAVGVAYAATRPANEPAPVVAPGTGAVTTQVAPPAVKEVEKDTVQDVVQIAILLDTSSSMDGLINQARSHLWSMVDELGKMTRMVNGKERGVRVELALYEYGNQRLSSRDGYLRQVLPFTSDLDSASETLHRLTTNGGEEYAAQAIQHAVSSLQWSAAPTDLRFIIVAGNEGFDQGQVKPDAALALAKAKDISVQLIHCGGQDPSWDLGAKMAGTDLLTIDQNQVAQHIPSPQDDLILQLNAQLNDTYIAYGASGAAAKQRQMNADDSSAKMSKKVAIERAQLKGKRAYKNTSWDLVDALEQDKDVLQKTKDEQLPAELRGKSLEEKQQLVAGKAAQRSDIKAKIAKLEAERADFLAKERAKQPASAEEKSLDTEVKKSAKKAASAKGYKL